MQPPSLHTSFFSSLKQVEKRLKLEHQSKPSNSSSQPVPETNCNLTSTESLSSPIYLHLDQTNSNYSTLQESSGSQAPQTFHSLSPEFPPTQQNPPHIPAHDEETDDIDDIQRLVQLLGLKDLVREEKGRVGDGGGCECEGGFYEKIIGVKGPKCEKEVERMEGWISYFLRDCDCDGEEPLRLAYLLLGKAAFDFGSGGLEFPSTVDDFLRHDPPKL
ncbi:hypothetical protein ACOSP7_011621 [Xanthoceras sorbifolium]|uniref:Uncharacterized protein n=1 Tax=Xanthoceras sorbifolium TaxID=99658 RepID=A0ABQ8HW76_9ROSI|nr:hypothetical protein JRO89_XS06G0021900 [Xanthoceras sorbifolium]